MKAWIHPIGGVMVWGIIFWFSLGPLVPVEHYLNATAYLSIFGDHAHTFMTTSSHGYVEQDYTPFHKAQIISNCFFFKTQQ